MASSTATKDLDSQNIHESSPSTASADTSQVTTEPFMDGTQASGKPQANTITEQSPSAPKSVGLQPVQTSGASPATSRRRPLLKHNESSHSLLRTALSSSRTRVFRRGDSASPSPASKQLRRRIPMLGQNLRSTPLGSPEIQAMVKREVVPNLGLVNQALEQIDLSPTATSDGEDSSPVKSLRLLAAHLRREREDCNKLLTEAMHERDVRGHPEICRAKCILIVQNGYAEAETRVYAYNMLATQASVGMAGYFLDQAVKLVDEGGFLNGGRREMMRDAIEVLKETLMEKDVLRLRKGKGVDRKKVLADLMGLRENDGDVRLELPKPAFAGRGDVMEVTPRTEKILQWAQ